VYPAGRHAAAQHLPQIATATDNGGDEIGQLMFVVGPLGYTPVGKPRPVRRAHILPTLAHRIACLIVSYYDVFSQLEPFSGF
jgi:hypothetical protein